MKLLVLRAKPGARYLHAMKVRPVKLHGMKVLG